jgi:HPt (histidine-containing phosphotransfer) domain-containing protein
MNQSLPASAKSHVPFPDASSSGRNDELEAVRLMFGEDYAQLATLYAADSPQRVATLREAVAADDRARVARLAHAFSGSCASIGATGLSDMCRDLESCAQATLSGELAEKLHAIETEYERICARLQSLLAAGP